MEGVFFLSCLRWARWLCIWLVLASGAYMAYFFSTQYHTLPVDPAASADPEQPSEGSALKSYAQEYGLLEEAIGSRDIFSPVKAANVPVETAAPPMPLNELPANLKVEGIIIADESQVIIEDTDLHQTYFISKDTPQAGISLQHADREEVVITYQGQSIRLPVQKSGTVNGQASTP